MKPTLLVVDDEKLSGRILEFYFEKKYEVIVLPSAEDAISWLKAGHHPDAVISDLEMKVLSGKDLLKYVKKQEWAKNTPVIILSGTESNSTQSECLLLGASDYMVKPFNPIKLEDRLNEIFLNQELCLLAKTA